MRNGHANSLTMPLVNATAFTVLVLMNERIGKASHQVQNDGRSFKATGSEPVPVPFWRHSRDKIRSVKTFPTNNNCPWKKQVTTHLQTTPERVDLFLNELKF